MALTVWNEIHEGHSSAWAGDYVRRIFSVPNFWRQGYMEQGSLVNFRLVSVSVWENSDLIMQWQQLDAVAWWKTQEDLQRELHFLLYPLPLLFTSSWYYSYLLLFLLLSLLSSYQPNFLLSAPHLQILLHLYPAFSNRRIEAVNTTAFILVGLLFYVFFFFKIFS